MTPASHDSSREDNVTVFLNTSDHLLVNLGVYITRSPAVPAQSFVVWYFWPSKAKWSPGKVQIQRPKWTDAMGRLACKCKAREAPQEQGMGGEGMVAKTGLLGEVWCWTEGQTDWGFNCSNEGVELVRGGNEDIQPKGKVSAGLGLHPSLNCGQEITDGSRTELRIVLQVFSIERKSDEGFSDLDRSYKDHW